MRADLDKYLCERYPVLFGRRHLSPQDTMFCFGFEHGDGWFGIIDILASVISEVAPDIQAQQVKEKFGTLRFYTTASNAGAYAAISAADLFSAKICEKTGQPGEMMVRGGREDGMGGFYQTLSPAGARTMEEEELRVLQAWNLKHGTTDDDIEPRRFKPMPVNPQYPPVHVRLAWPVERAMQWLTARHDLGDGVVWDGWPAILVDLTSSCLRAVRCGRQNSGGKPELARISFTKAAGLQFVWDAGSIDLAARDRLLDFRERKARFDYKDRPDESFLFDLRQEIHAIELFASRMSLRMDLDTGAVPVPMSDE